MLTARDAIEIAADNGLPYRQFKDDILACIHQARAAGLKRVVGMDGRARSAREYFSGYMRDIAFESMCDSIASRRAE